MPVKNDSHFRHLKADEKDYKRSDSGGLFMLVTKTGSKLWRYAYRFDAKQKLLAIGQYPLVSLADARTKRDNAKRLLADGIDPSVERKAERRQARIARSNTFEAVAKELMDEFEAEGDAPNTLKKKQWLLDFANKELGKRPIAELKAPEILDALRKVERRGKHETATRLRGTVGAVFRFAIATGRAERDPTGDLRGALITPTVTHRATIVEPNAVGALLRAIDGFEGQAVTRYALKLAPLVFVRPGELRKVEWTEFSPAASNRRIVDGTVDGAAPTRRAISRVGIPADFNLITSRTWRIANLSVGIQVPLRKAERRDRLGARRGLVTPGDIIPERWARSFRNGGRHRAESA